MIIKRNVRCEQCNTFQDEIQYCNEVEFISNIFYDFNFDIRNRKDVCAIV